MDNTIYNIKISDGEESSIIKSSMITRVYNECSANFIIITGYINFFEPIIYKRTIELINWAMKKEKFSSSYLSDLEITVIRDGGIIENIEVKKADVLSYMESGDITSGFQKFEIAIQSRETNIKSYYFFYEINNRYRHILFKISKKDEKRVDCYFERDNYLDEIEININFKVIEIGKSSYSGNFIFDMNETEKLKLERNETEEFYKKIADILKDSIKLSETEDILVSCKT